MSKRGLPVTLKMRHDAHYVDALATSAGNPIGRMVPIELIDPNPEQPRQLMATCRSSRHRLPRRGLSSRWSFDSAGLGSRSSPASAATRLRASWVFVSSQWCLEMSTTGRLSR